MCVCCFAKTICICISVLSCNVAFASYLNMIFASGVCQEVGLHPQYRMCLFALFPNNFRNPRPERDKKSAQQWLAWFCDRCVSGSPEQQVHTLMAEVSTVIEKSLLFYAELSTTLVKHSSWWHQHFHSILLHYFQRCWQLWCSSECFSSHV